MMRRARLNIKPKLVTRGSTPSGTGNGRSEAKPVQSEPTPPPVSDHPSQKQDSSYEQPLSPKKAPIVSASDCGASSSPKDVSGGPSEIGLDKEIDGNTPISTGSVQESIFSKIARNISKSVIDGEADKNMNTLDSLSLPDSVATVSQENNDENSTQKDGENTKAKPFETTLTSGKVPAKTSAPIRRGRFPKAKPNIAEAGRPTRIRHPSFTAVDKEPEVAKKHTTPAPKSTVTPQPEVETSLAAVTPSKSGSEGGSSSDKPSVTASRTEPDKQADKSPKKKGQAQEKDKDGESTSIKQESKVKKRKVEILEGPINRSKMTMRDLIYMNPVKNPMRSSEIKNKSSPEAESKKQPQEEEIKIKTEPNVERSLSAVARRALEKSVTVSGNDDVDIVDLTLDDEEDDAMPVPQVKIGPDGQIMLNEESLVLKNPALQEKEPEGDTIHENERECDWVNAMSFRKWTRAKHWKPKETKKFYLALGAVGTDFSLMESLFSNRSRTELKRKFKREEKLNRVLIEKAIRQENQFDLALFKDPSSEDSEEERAKQPKKRGRKKAEKPIEVDAEEETGKKKAPKKKRKKKKVPTATLR